MISPLESAADEIATVLVTAWSGVSRTFRRRRLWREYGRKDHEPESQSTRCTTLGIECEKRAIPTDKKAMTLDAWGEAIPIQGSTSG